MHEVQVARDLLDRAERAAADAEATEIETVDIAVGQVTHLNPKQLRFAIETVAEGTIAEEATVEIETVPPEAVCECGWEGTPETLETAQILAPTVTCPECDRRLEFTAGRECRLTSVEVPEPTSTTPP
ncbi:MAG: hydrogenase maturation nickel metallochaperone HypA [Halodesulfurarchaeum sp.]